MLSVYSTRPAFSNSFADQHDSRKASVRGGRTPSTCHGTGWRRHCSPPCPPPGDHLELDRLFELPAKMPSEPRTVLPENVPAVGNNWLLNSTAP